jgi:hypothetical protein
VRFGDAQGWAHVAIGHGGHYDAAGHYRYAAWREHPYWWPQQAQRAVSAVAAAAVSADAHVSPYLTQDRRIGAVDGAIGFAADDSANISGAHRPPFRPKQETRSPYFAPKELYRHRSARRRA